MPQCSNARDPTTWHERRRRPGRGWCRPRPRRTPESAARGSPTCQRVLGSSALELRGRVRDGPGAPGPGKHQSGPNSRRCNRLGRCAALPICSTSVDGLPECGIRGRAGVGGVEAPIKGVMSLLQPPAAPRGDSPRRSLPPPAPRSRDFPPAVTESCRHVLMYPPPQPRPIPSRPLYGPPHCGLLVDKNFCL